MHWPVQIPRAQHSQPSELSRDPISYQVWSKVLGSRMLRWTRDTATRSSNPLLSWTLGVSNPYAHDGAPTENLYGCDLHSEFLDIGYKLFKDSSILPSKAFFPADLFAQNSPDLKALEGQLDIIWAASFLHLFPWPTQVQAVKHIITLLKPTPGSLVVGKQLGHATAGEFAHAGAPQKSMYRHDEHSFKKLWEQVGQETETEWDVTVESKTIGGAAWAPDGSLGLRFSARRL